MSNAIRFLESVGSHPLSAAEYAASVQLLDLDGSQRQALLDRNQLSLNEMLGGRKQLIFAVCAAEEE